MTRRWFLVGLCGGAAAQEPAPDAYEVREQMDHVVKFAVVFDEYVRTLFGCPDKKDWKAEECKPAEGHTDVSLFIRCRNLAKKAFDLK